MDKELIDFIQAMEHDNWEPVRDMYQNIYEWRHRYNTVRVVTHTNAFNMWKVNRCTPLAI